MKLRSIFLAVALAALALPAAAADLPSRKAVYAPFAVTAPSWTGFYVGALAGIGWSDTANQPVWFSQGGPNPTLYPSSIQLNSDYAQLGGTVGWDGQVNNFVVGLLGDFRFNVGSSNTTSFATQTLLNGGVGFGQLRTDWQKEATARARVGYLLSPSLLAYVTGGAAFAEPGVNIGILQTSATPWASANYGGLRAGLTYGGGLEFLLPAVGGFSNLSIKAEFLRTDLGHVQSLFQYLGTNGSFGSAQANYHAIGNRATVGINWRFGGGGNISGNPTSDLGLPVLTGNLSADGAAYQAWVKSHAAGL